MRRLKQFFRDLPIRRKIVLSIMVVSGMATLVTCASFFVLEFFGFQAATERQLAVLGDIISANSTAALDFDNPKDATEILSALRADEHVEAAAIYNKRGMLFAKFSAAPGIALPVTPGNVGYAYETRALAGFQPIVLGEKTLGTLYIRYSLGALYDRLWLYSGTVAVILGATFLLSYGLSAILERLVSKPVMALAATAEAITESKDYSLRAPPAGLDEIGKLTTSFNHMLSELEAMKQGLEVRVADRTRELQEANRELEAFSYSVSHDLRAPLRHIHGFITLLQNHAGAGLDEKGLRFMDTISRAAGKMGRLIEDLLAFSRIGRTEMRLIEVEHDALVARVIRENGFDHPPKPVAWSIAALPRVKADPGLLSQVWFNLIDNAIKYSGKVPAPRIEIGAIPAERETREHVFFVRDNGVGFDMKYASKLFGVFQRLHGPAEFDGTGIGLANVQRIVVRHGGRVWAESKPDSGSSFFFTLPAIYT